MSDATLVVRKKYILDYKNGEYQPRNRFRGYLMPLLKLLDMMIQHTYKAATLICSLAFVLPSQAGSGSSAKSGMDSAKHVVEVVAAAPECSTRQIQPLFSRYAQTTKKWTIRGSYRSFTDMELQEIDQFDGSSYDVELTAPLGDRWQLRLYYPLHTEGDAREMGSGDDVDVEGDGGLLDFPSLTVDWQFKQANSADEWNMAAYFGLGTVREYLESVNQVTGEIDRINHRGAVALFGLKADKQLTHCWTLIGNLGGRYYWDSDDIHPNDGNDIFFLLDASAAFVYAPHNAWAYPMIELVYQGSFTDYNSLQIVPQVVVPIGEHIDINAGISLGILDDGPSTDARLQMTLRF